MNDLDTLNARLAALEEQSEQIEERRAAYLAKVRAMSNEERGIPAKVHFSQYGMGISTEDRLPEIGETIYYYVSDGDWSYTQSKKAIRVSKITERSVIGYARRGGGRGVMSRDKQYGIENTATESRVLDGIDAEASQVLTQRRAVLVEIQDLEEAERKAEKAAAEAESQVKRQALADRYLAVFAEVAGRVSDAALEQYVSDERDVFGLLTTRLEAAIWGAENAPKKEEKS